ncbi:MAG: hypothetical protein IE931_03320 [Sphingobacteriales bacterium]|nr:hypothetical protein [Sphingobacteriales bacterium]
MALDKNGLKATLGGIYDDTLDNADLTPEEAKNAFISRLADAIETFVKTAKVNYTSGLTSATGGVVSGTFNHTIS